MPDKELSAVLQNIRESTLGIYKTGAWSALAIVLIYVVGIAVYFSYNSIFSMVYLSDEYARATDAATRQHLLAAGHAFLSSFNGSGTGPFMAFTLYALSGLLVSAVMWTSPDYGRWIAVRKVTMEINTKAPLVGREHVLIQASPEVVWAIQSNVDGWPEWQTGISQAKLDGVLRPGAVFVWKSGGFAVTSTLEEVEAGRRIAWTGKALGSHARHVWMFQPQNGGTLVTTEESMEGWLIALLKPLMPGFLDKSLDLWLKNLKARAETTPRPG